MLTSTPAMPTPGPETYLNQDLLDSLQKRLSRIEGHVRGVRKMLSTQRDCDEVLTQVSGINAAISQVAILLLEGHLDSCVREALRSGDSEPVGRFKSSLARALK